MLRHLAIQFEFSPKLLAGRIVPQVVPEEDALLQHQIRQTSLDKHNWGKVTFNYRENHGYINLCLSALTAPDTLLKRTQSDRSTLEALEEYHTHAIRGSQAQFSGSGERRRADLQVLPHEHVVLQHEVRQQDLGDLGFEGQFQGLEHPLTPK